MNSKDASTTVDLVQRLLTPQEADSVSGAHYTRHYMSGNPHLMTYHEVLYTRTIEEPRYKQSTQEN